LGTQLSLRLQTLFSQVEVGSRVVDVGTDHAWLPIALAQHGVASFVIATDVALGPYQRALTNVQAHGADESVSVRQGDGLKSVLPGEVNTVIIAGMGGGTAAEILLASQDVLMKVDRLILQPMNAAVKLRKTAYELGYGLAVEVIVPEDGRLYEVIVASKQVDRDVAFSKFSDELSGAIAYELGPLILNKKTAVNRTWVQHNIAEWTRIVGQLQLSKTPQSVHRLDELQQKVAWASSWLDGDAGTH